MIPLSFSHLSNSNFRPDYFFRGPSTPKTISSILESVTSASFAEPVTAVPIYDLEVCVYDPDFAQVLEVLVEDDSSWACANNEHNHSVVPIAQAEEYSPIQGNDLVLLESGTVTAIPVFDVDSAQSFMTYPSCKSIDSLKDDFTSRCQEIDGTRGAGIELDWDIEEFQNYLYLQDIENIEETGTTQFADGSDDTALMAEQSHPQSHPQSTLIQQPVQPGYFDTRSDLDVFVTNASKFVTSRESSFGETLAPVAKRARDFEYEGQLLKNYKPHIHSVVAPINSSEKSFPSSSGLSRRQLATSKREREKGKFKKNTTCWVSVTDLFDS